MPWSLTQILFDPCICLKKELDSSRFSNVNRPDNPIKPNSRFKFYSDRAPDPKRFLFAAGPPSGRSQGGPMKKGGKSRLLLGKMGLDAQQLRLVEKYYQDFERTDSDFR